MTCKPSHQSLRVEAQTIISEESSRELFQRLMGAFHPSWTHQYEMHRQEPEKESGVRNSLLYDLRDQITLARSLSSLADKLPIGDTEIGVDDYLDRFKEAVEQKTVLQYRGFGEFLIAELADNTILIQKTNLILEKPIEPMLVCFDETQYWKEGEPKVQQAGRIFATYLIDTSTAYTMAEITPSYDLRWIYTTPENDDEENSVSEWIITHNNPASELDGSMYIRNIDRLSDSKKLFDQRHYLEEDQTYEQAMESLIDHLKGNPKLETPAIRRLAPGL